MEKWYDVSATLKISVGRAIEAESEEEALQILLVDQEFEDVIDTMCEEIVD